LDLFLFLIEVLLSQTYFPIMSEKNIDVLSPSSLGSPTFSHDEDVHGKGESSSGSGSEAAAYAEHGPGIDHKITQDNVIESEPELLWSRIRHFMRDPFSEFLGVFILILFGDGVVAQVVLSGATKGDYQSISWGWGYVNPPARAICLLNTP
jgi:aquaglyceroporin related protein